jgi:translation initiation factor 2 beta subunit (eIF-2beta)/eIF-5
MKRRKRSGSEVFVSPTPDGHLVVVDAASHRKALEQIISDSNPDRLAEYLTKVFEDDGKIDSRGRLRLPSVFTNFLRSK